MPPRMKLKGRYEVRDILGQGGMGVVYKAYDAVVQREVALKTLRDIPSPNALQLFQKECAVLASLSHPNIVEIFDIGEFEEQGELKPFFVMPLLPGVALDKIIHGSSQRLTVERAVEIITQTCRGLHAAHERGLVHRDLKPSNVFVMSDDSVKIIDFGVALMVDSRTTRGQKGTLLYMAPEQIEMKPLSALSDIFSLGVVCYETFTGRRPFERSTEGEVADAILHQFPPPASEINPAVSQSLSRVIHKAMAKQPWHRFSNTREFSETLGRALRNEPIEIFDASRIQPRIQRARKAFDQGDFQFAGEILSELEAEGHLDPEISDLRRQIDQAERQKKVRQLLESARTRLEEDEYPLALQKIQEVLQLDPENAAALGLKSTIESKRNERKIEDWFRLAHQHVSNHAYSHARQALQNVLQLRPRESKALQLLSEVDRREQEYLKLRQEKEEAYKAAQEAWRSGEVSAALSKMGVVLELDRRSPDSSAPDRSNAYQNFYNQVRSEHDAINNAHAEARKHLADRDFAKARAICDSYLAKYSDDALFQALKFEVDEQERQERSSFIAEVDRRVEAERDLVKRVTILEEALGRFPGEAHFERSLRLMREKRDLVNSIVAKARLYEERGQFVEALSQWEILRTIYSQFPGLDFETERVMKRRDQQACIDSRTRWIKQIEQQLQWSDYARALELLKQTKVEFPNDGELAELEKLAQQGMERAAQVQTLLAQGQEFCSQRRFQEGIEILRKAYELDEHNPTLRAALSDALAEQAHGLVEADWHAAESLIEQALEIDPGHALAKSLRTLASDRTRQEVVDQCLSQSRQLQAGGDLEGARAEVDKGLAAYPQDPRLKERQAALNKELTESRSRQSRRRDLEELRALDRDSAAMTDLGAMKNISQRAQNIAERHPDDPEFQSLAGGVGRRLETITPHSDSETRAEPPQAPPRTPPPARVPSQEASRPQTAPFAPRIPAVPVPAPAPAPLPVAADELRSKKPVSPLVLVAVVAVVIIASGAAVATWYLTHRGSKPVPASPIAVTLNTAPPGAKIRIDGEDRGASPLRIELSEGTYQIEAQKEGYQPLSKSVNVKSGLDNSVDLALEPMAQTLRLVTDLDSGNVLLDGNQVRKIQEGQDVVIEGVEPGKHTLKVASGRAEAAVDFESAAVSMARIIGPVQAKGMTAVFITSQAGQARVEASSNRVKVSLDGKEVGIGTDLNDLAPGNHDLVLSEGKEQKTATLATGPAPTLDLYLSSGARAVMGEAGGKKTATTTTTPPITRPVAPPSHGEPAAGSSGLTVAHLNQLGYEAFRKGSFVSPPESSAVSYFQQVLKLDPNNDYAKKLIEDSVKATKDQVEQTIKDKNFASAHRIAGALEKLLPGRGDVAELQKEISAAEKVGPQAPKEAAPAVSFQVRHMHDQKAYCEGTLEIVGPHLKFAAKTATDGHRHNFDVACSAASISKKGSRFHLLHQADFIVNTGSEQYDFVPSNGSSDTIVSSLNKACGK